MRDDSVAIPQKWLVWLSVIFVISSDPWLFQLICCYPILTLPKWFGGDLTRYRTIPNSLSGPGSDSTSTNTNWETAGENDVMGCGVTLMFWRLLISQ